MAQLADLFIAQHDRYKDERSFRYRFNSCVNYTWQEE